MDSPTPLTRRDRVGLIALCVLLFGWPIVLNRSLSTHETVHTHNVREMLRDGDWWIPHYGGRVWLERPPLPHWLTAIPVYLIGDPHADWAYRLSSALAASVCVLLIASLAARWYGRNVGLLAGVALATIREFLNYAIAPECDIFLCGIVTSALYCFARAEFAEPTPSGWNLWGNRSWSVWGFFVLLGLTNLAKGLFFGMFLVAVPVGLYLLSQRSVAAFYRYVWVWGILAFVVVASTWGAIAYWRRPDVVDLWASDYLGRWNQGYMREPTAYYLIQLPWILFPWTLLAFVGLAQAVPLAWRQPRSAERFLVCWALGAIGFLSIPEGKHHHYLLHGLAPWAVLAARGAIVAWTWLHQSAPMWLHSVWWIPSTAALLVVAGLGVAHAKVPHLFPYWPMWLIAGPLCCFVLWWVCCQTSAQRAAVGLVVALLLGHGFSQAYQTYVLDFYTADRVFAQQVAQRIAAGERIYVLNDLHPLDASWMLYYLPDGTPLLHNVTYLHDATIPGPTVQLVAKRYFEPLLKSFGEPKLQFQSEYSRNWQQGPECWGLYEVRLHPGLWRGPIDATITAMQATGRAPGPWIGPGGVAMKYP